MNHQAAPEFDSYATAYDAALNSGLALSGEAKEYFAEHRVRWLKACLGGSQTGGQCLDFGCGTGSGTPYLMEQLQLDALTGADPSGESLAVARSLYRVGNVDFISTVELAQYPGTFDLAYCNGVFHHIPLEQRKASAELVFRSLKPGGYFAFWENNPWNPMVHVIMSRVSFDADAVLLWPHEARRLLREAGFEIVRTDYCFIFPALLASCRFLEPKLCKLPLGGQYQILGRKLPV